RTPSLVRRIVDGEVRISRLRPPPGVLSFLFLIPEAAGPAQLEGAESSGAAPRRRSSAASTACPWSVYAVRSTVIPSNPVAATAGRARRNGSVENVAPQSAGRPFMAP